jgi:hypothetical protein
MRFQSKLILIVDKTAIWVYQQKDGAFSRERYIKKYVTELEKPDDFR